MVIKMKIKSVLNILNEIRYMKSVLRKNGHLLAAGRYRVFDSFRAMSLEDDRVLACAHPYFDKPGISFRMAWVAAWLNKIGYFANRNKCASGKYEAFYTANNYDKVREVKLFSFRNNKILTICTSEAEVEKQIGQYEQFSKAYPMPTVKRNDCAPNSFEIAMVQLKPFPGDDAALRAIARATMSFHSSADELERISARELIGYDYEDEQINRLLNGVVEQIDESLLDQAYASCVQHGDLSKDNLIYGESDGATDFWWIDWEHAAQRVFFYDYFFYILNSAMYYDTAAYERYMSGAADLELKEFFGRFGATFVPEKRRDYFLIFAVDFLKERVCDFGRVAALNAYCEFITTH